MVDCGAQPTFNYSPRSVDATFNYATTLDHRSFPRVIAARNRLLFRTVRFRDWEEISGPRGRERERAREGGITAEIRLEQAGVCS
ncbi:hypothetical protein MUK42_28446 [Musa troglodytarum]|uniref:Uncharacterized protein n=1 Tax=Musa troglodytarum TaxID=320322 RepID=A0A9E7JPL6_9LILI|nr:hypothetical protein MUK42_28446 [Musa troglodytarum]